MVGLCVCQKLTLCLATLVLVAGLNESSASTSNTQHRHHMNVATNLVRNPRFTSKEDDGRPTNWVATSGGVFTAIEQHSIAHPTALLYNGTRGAKKPQCIQFASTNPCWCYQRINTSPGKRYRVSARFWGSENASPSIAVQWTKCGTWNGGSYPSHSHDPDTEGWKIVSQEFVLPPDIDRDGVTIALFNGYFTPANGTALFDNVEVAEVHPPPIRSVLVSPSYRGRILASPGTIRVRTWINDPTPVLEVSLKRSEVVLTSRTAEWPQQLAAIDLELSDEFSETGSYQVYVKVLSLNRSTIYYQESHNLTRVRDGTKAAKVVVDNEQRLQVDGDPVFPIGLYFSVFQMNESMLQLVADSAFNTVLPYDNMQNISLTLDGLDIAHKHRIHVIVPVYDWPDFNIAKSRINIIKKHPATMAWYTSDEKGLNWVPQLRQLYEYIVSADYDHPTYSVFTAGQVADISDYLDVCDILGTDPYPIGDGPGINASMAGDWGRYTVEGTFGATPVWQVIQGFSHNNSLIPMWPKTGTFRTPTLDEMRSMTWQSICEGANGVILYSFFEFMRESDHVTFEQQWSRAKVVAQEVAVHSSTLLEHKAPTPRVDFTFISTRAHWQNNVYMLFVVNNGNGEGPVTFSLDWQIKQIDVLKPGSNSTVARSIDPDFNRFTDVVLPLAAVVYRISLRSSDTNPSASF